MEDKRTVLENLMKSYSQFREKKIEGRYITHTHIKNLIESYKNEFAVREIGKSFEGVSINTITWGSGKIKVLAWSQMHGNESTTTKAVFDLLRAFKNFKDDPLIMSLKDRITIKIIPMLNPDGAQRYTRENANKIDLNRDALRLKEPESKILRSTFKEFDPDFCFNLHDQRTIFSAGMAPYPASLSFLTPAMDENRELYPERIISMQVISAIVQDLKPWLPNEIGRYSDEFNPNCTGDTFQSLGKPTILFEAGHFPKDYHREISRKYITTALFSALRVIACNSWKEQDYNKYFQIPENKKLFYDLILRNAIVNNEKTDIALQFKEILEDGKINFQPSIEKIEKSLNFYGHREIDCKNMPVKLEEETPVRENVIVHNLYLNNEVLAINYQNI